MNTVKAVIGCAIVLASALPSVAKDFVIPNVPTLRARAYVDQNYRKSESSRYDMEIVRPSSTDSWDFTFENNPDRHHTNITGNISRVSYTAQQKTTSVKLTLHQYQTIEERVTFRNLDLMPASPKNSMPSRLLSVEEPITQTTPSGIHITIPAQRYNSIFKALANDKGVTTIHGNMSAIFFDVRTSPDKREVVLPQSPLYQKHKKPVTIKLDCIQPNFMVWYMADNTFKKLAVSVPNLATVQHLDELTFVVRQRVNLRSIPLVLQVPIESQ